MKPRYTITRHPTGRYLRCWRVADRKTGWMLADNMTRADAKLFAEAKAKKGS